MAVPFLRQAEKDLKDALDKHEKFSKYMGKYSLMVLDNGIAELRNEVGFLKRMME